MKSKIVSALIILGVSVMIGFTISILYGSMVYWLATFKQADTMNLKLYMGSLLMAILSGNMFFLKIFIKTLGSSIKDLEDG